MNRVFFVMALLWIVWPLVLHTLPTLPSIQANNEEMLPHIPPMASDTDIIQIDETEILPQTAKSHEETKIRHQKKTDNPTNSLAPQKGGYKTKEEIHKPPTFDHPCNLTRTSIKISFPALKHELFVNFLGYKEPNLVYLWRCKGTCGEATSPIACSPTRTSEKKVNMMFKVKVKYEYFKEIHGYIFPLNQGLSVYPTFLVS